MPNLCVHRPTRPRIPYTFLAQSLPLPPSISLPQTLVDEYCSPLSLRDFYSYLRLAEHAQENLLFVLWFRDYEKRFAALPEEVRKRAAELDPYATWEEYVKERDGESSGPETIEPEWAGRADDIESQSTLVLQPSASGNSGIDVEAMAIAPWMMDEIEDVTEEDKKKMQAIVASADAELEKTVQLLLRDNLPLREEIARVVLRFLTPSSPSALSSQHIRPLLATLRRTTHPGSFRLLYNEIYNYLLLDAHPRFVRASLSNAAVPFRDILMVLAAGCYLAMAFAVLLTCILIPGINRGWRAFSLPPIWAASWIILCLANGLCPILFALRKRQFQLWEVMREEEYDPMPERGEPAQGMLGKTDWWSTSKEVRRLQMQMFLKAVRWSALTVVLWTAIVLPVPGRK